MQVCMRIQQKKKILHRGMFKIHKSGVKFWISEGSGLKIHLNRVALPSMQRESVLMKNVNTIGVFQTSEKFKDVI